MTYRVTAVDPERGYVVLARNFQTAIDADKWLRENLLAFPDYCGFCVEQDR